MDFFSRARFLFSNWMVNISFCFVWLPFTGALNVLTCDIFVCVTTIYVCRFVPGTECKNDFYYIISWLVTWARPRTVISRLCSLNWPRQFRLPVAVVQAAVIRCSPSVAPLYIKEKTKFQAANQSVRSSGQTERQIHKQVPPLNSFMICGKCGLLGNYMYSCFLSVFGFFIYVINMKT